MNNSKLVKILASFKQSEIREFSRFVNSPFHNGRRETAKFFAIIKSYYPAFKEGKFTPENIFRQMYPEKKYNAAVITKLSSFTYGLAEKYLAFKGMDNDPFYFSMALSVQYSQKGFFSLSEKQANKLDKVLCNKPGDYEFYFWKKYLIERQKSAIYSYERNDHLASAAIINRTNMLSYHMAVLTCRSLISLCINEKNFNTDYSDSDFYSFAKNLGLGKYIKILSDKNSPFYPVISAEYYQAMALLYPGNNDYFRRFKIIMQSGLDKFTFIEKLNFYSIFESVCTLKIEDGSVGFSGDLFEAYKEMLSKGLYSYTEGGEFIPRIFRNIVHTALLVKQYGWLEEFINAYAGKLPGDSMKSLQSFGLALLYFSKAEFESSLNELLKIDYELFHFKIDVKNLQLKLYFELGYAEEAASVIDSYRHFIAGNKFISERYRRMCSGFINCYQRLLRAKNNETGKTENLMGMINNYRVDPINRQWLERKAAELSV